MTFQEYINNPMGNKNSVMSYRKVYENLYQDKWNKIMVRENGKIDYELYHSKNEYFIYLKIPSEVIEKFYYDVVIKFTIDKTTNMLDKANCGFFSNDPSFNYTFAHAFVKHKIHVPELESKMSKVALKRTAKEKNPSNEIGYVKSLFFAYIFMQEKGLFAKAKYDLEGKSFDKKILLSKIKDTDTCIMERQNAAKELAEEKRKEKLAQQTEAKRTPNNTMHKPKQNQFIGTTRTTKTVGRVGGKFVKVKGRR